jgi:large conductance mechanosensitive channel
VKILSEFREFISRGSVIDLSVGVIIGAAFGKLVSSLVDQVIMPPIGLATGGVDFAQLKVVLKPAAGKAAEVAILYGAFINTVIQFLIIGATVFLLVKMLNAVRRLTAAQEAREGAPAAAAPSPTETLLMEIRDLLKSRASSSPAAPAPSAAHQKGSAPRKRS